MNYLIVLFIFWNRNIPDLAVHNFILDSYPEQTGLLSEETRRIAKLCLLLKLVYPSKTKYSKSGQG